NHGIGSKVLHFVLEDLKNEDTTIYLNSQEKAVPFYERYGFVKSGEPFMEAGIRHFLMYYNA
ncbi:MAG: GNAT family N-acetyltransferase, partial [Bacteroidota bacterium]